MNAQNASTALGAAQRNSLPVTGLISLLVPTRNRSDILVQMLDSVFATAARPELIEVVIYVDDDDPDTLSLDLRNWNVRRITGQRLRMGALNAACFAASRGSIIILGNDDILIRTQGWDDLVRHATAQWGDEVYLLYPNDLYKLDKLCTFPIMSRLVCDTIGDPFPAEYRGAFIDVHLMDIFKQLEGGGHARIKFLGDVVFEHMHFRAGKSEPDATYLNRERFGDDKTFILLSRARSWAATRLLTLIEGTEPVPEARLQSHKPAGGWFIGLLVLVLGESKAPLRWRVKLFLQLCARLGYNKLSRLARWAR